jgi:hypothetical protein
MPDLWLRVDRGPISCLPDLWRRLAAGCTGAIKSGERDDPVSLAGPGVPASGRPAGAFDLADGPVKPGGLAEAVAQWGGCLLCLILPAGILWVAVLWIKWLLRTRD